MEEGADVDAPGDHASYGPRALHVGAMVGCDEPMLDLLLEFGAELNEGMNGLEAKEV